MQGFQALLIVAGLWGKRASVVFGAATLVYLLFFAKLGYQSVASHIADIWYSPVMQEKRDLAADELSRVGDDLKDLVDEDLLKKAGEQTSPAKQAAKAEKKELKEEDKSSLDKLIESVAF
jgi:hypothetical protein